MESQRRDDRLTSPAPLALMLAVLVLAVAVMLGALPWHNLVCKRGHYEVVSVDGRETRAWRCDEEGGKPR